jgi:predicted Zn-dependent protease
MPLIPVLGAIRVYDQGNITHDRYLYLPSVGLSILFGLVAKLALAERGPIRKLSLVVAGILFCIGAYLTVSQQKFYRSNEALYERAIAVAPENATVIDYLGNMYLSRNDTERALGEYRKAHSLVPEDPNATFFLAQGLLRSRQYAAAEPLLGELSTNTGQQHQRFCSVRLFLAISQAHLGKLAPAEENLRKLSDLDSNFPGLHRALGAVLQTEGRVPEAQAEYAREYQVSKDPVSKRQALYLAQIMLNNHAMRTNGQNSPPDAGTPMLPEPEGALR